ncbi:ABC transporter permease [Dethiobacter alkaliphilus]|uniref:Transport permease protein n=1 Tax=Dethiobacter alkaliphilus AHT 1 TaxID=555088 RepID=C0GHF3_DETAL|nr:ABC transporter permease [Dethiobacter alkaliphilus]EEG77159.1 ABC-2 type transporter [Dethiobacter alkaliphilus AHT 1]
MSKLWQSYRTLNRYALRVFRRNLAVFRSTWKTNIAFNFLEPLLYLAAMGWGLGAFVGEIDGMSYMQFIAPGIIASSAMWAASAECTYESYVRMHYQKIFHAITATPINLDEVVTGELLTGVFKSVLYGSVILLVIAVLGLVPSFFAVLIPLVLVLCGFVFAQLGMIWTGIVPKIDSFSYFFTLVVTPMFLFSGVFFPIDALPEAVQAAAWLLPLYHIVVLLRSLTMGAVSAALLIHALWLVTFIIVIFPLPQHLMQKRLIK